jgi:hypothetical protein
MKSQAHPETAAINKQILTLRVLNFPNTVEPTTTPQALQRLNIISGGIYPFPSMNNTHATAPKITVQARTKFGAIIHLVLHFHPLKPRKQGVLKATNPVPVSPAHLRKRRDESLRAGFARHRDDKVSLPRRGSQLCDLINPSFQVFWRLVELARPMVQMRL